MYTFVGVFEDTTYIFNRGNVPQTSTVMYRFVSQTMCQHAERIVALMVQPLILFYCSMMVIFVCEHFCFEIPIHTFTHDWLV